MPWVGTISKPKVRPARRYLPRKSLLVLSGRIVIGSFSPLRSFTVVGSRYSGRALLPGLLCDRRRLSPRMPSPETEFAAAYLAESFWRRRHLVVFTGDRNLGFF